jgi:uncharacterized protein (TIGR02453 family)
MMAMHFTPEAMKFLRGLARNNDREWFEARRDVYERALKAPMLALVDEINAAMVEFAPEHVRPPHKVVMRIYRDIRFSPNKQPYKTHLAAWWARRGMEKTSGGGFYLQISPQQVMVAAGVYMPEREQLLMVRRWMRAHHESYRASLKKLLKARGATVELSDDAEALTRMPKGFAKDDPADELVRAKSWGVRSLLPAEAVLETTLSREIARRFRMMAPLIETLNGAILHRDDDASRERSMSARKPLF